MLFKKKNPASLVRRIEQGQEKLAERIARYLLEKQKAFAQLLNGRINRLSHRGKQTALVVFCLLFAGLSIHAFYGVFRTGHPMALKPDQVAVPNYYHQQDEERHVANIREIDTARIHQFQTYLDSLQKSPSGKLVYDSIQGARPGLLDSLQLLKKLYSTQNN